MVCKLTTVVTLSLLMAASVAFDTGRMTAVAQDDSAPTIGESGEVTLVDDPDNILAKELLGTWEGDAEICERMGVKHDDKGWVIIEKDEAAQAKVLKDLKAWLAELRASELESDKVNLAQWERACQTIYLAGRVRQIEVAEGSANFALTIMNGNPCMVLWLSDKAKPSGVVRVGIAQDVEGDGDILFMGKRPNENMAAMVRKPAETEEKD